ncbi:MAG: hypothetical protein ACI9LV_000786 [Candidatus Nanohaloarchaea archaeon]|jgi:hypothetical protein
MDRIEAKAIGILNQQESQEMPLPDLDKELGDESRMEVVSSLDNSDKIKLEPVIGEDYAYHVAKLQLENNTT